MIQDSDPFSDERPMRRKRRATTWGVLAVVILLGFYVLVPPVWQLRDRSVTVRQWLKKSGERLANVGPGEKDWIKAEAVSKHVLNAFIVAEDGRFMEHNGLDLNAIRLSFIYNLKRGRFARGGSTITQQVVKMAFLTRDKNLIRKGREALGALLLEVILDKQQILEWYLNLAEFGDGVYGIKAAAWHYFRTKPELLTISQAVQLAMVLPSPNGWSRGLRTGSLSEFGQKRFAHILTHMRIVGSITESQWLNALATGNFGRPVLAYEAALKSVRERERAENPNVAESDDVEIATSNTFLLNEEEESEGLEKLAEAEENPGPTIAPTPSVAPSIAPSPVSE